MPEVNAIRQLVVVTPNEVGTLERICAAIRTANGGLSHICASALGEDARFMLNVHDREAVRGALEALEYEVTEAEVLQVAVNNATGSLEPIAEALGREDIDIEFLYATSADGKKATCVMATNDNGRALEVLKAL